jgi:hypothetical protein
MADETRYCWHCGDRKAEPSQILCVPCLDEAGELLGDVTVGHVQSLLGLQQRLAAATAALLEYQRLSKVSRPSAVVDGVDLLNERYKELVK